jgi:hypothetical protein
MALPRTAPKTFRLRHPNTHPVLQEAILCLCAATEAQLGLQPEDGAQFHTLSIPGAGRVLAHEAAIRAWFRTSFEEYAAYLAEHLVTHSEIGWTDLLTFSVPFRLDRLCLTLTVGAPSVPTEAPDASVYWNWSAARETLDPSQPSKAERRIHLIGQAPPVPGFDKGHQMALAELLLCSQLKANPSRLALRPALRLLETAPLPVPAAPVELKPSPSGKRTGDRKEAAAQFVELGNPRLLEALHGALPASQEPQRHWLPDGREITLVDWEDLLMPFGRRVQSKVASVMRVDYLGGHLYWEAREILERHKQRGAAIPGKKITLMHFRTQLGRVSLNSKQLLWAYWTAEVPDSVRRMAQVPSAVSIGSLDGIYNMAAKGYKFGTVAEQEAAFEHGYREKAGIWRDVTGKEAFFVLKDRTLKGAFSMSFGEKQGSPEAQIRQTRRLPEEIATIFARKVKKGELELAEAYRRAMILATNDGSRCLIERDDIKHPFSPEEKEIRSWLGKEEGDSSRVLRAYLATLPPKNRASIPILMAMKMGKASEDVNDFSQFAEWRVFPPERDASIIQAQFRRLLGAEPRSYGAEPVDMEELADQRGRLA